MLEEKGNLWEKHAAGSWIVIPTNLKTYRGRAIMGAGLAKEARDRFSNLDFWLGEQLYFGGRLVPDWATRLFLFPTKDSPYENSDINLIEDSAIELERVVSSCSSFKPPIYLPRVGCGLGKLRWLDVRLVLEAHLDDRFVVLTR